MRYLEIFLGGERGSRKDARGATGWEGRVGTVHSSNDGGPAAGRHGEAMDGCIPAPGGFVFSQPKGYGLLTWRANRTPLG